MKYQTFLFVVLIVFVLLILTQIIGVSWKSKVLSEWCQPAEVNYDSFGPYCLRIIKQTKTLGSSLIMAIVNQGNYQSGDYGYTLNYPFNNFSGEYDQETTVIWQNNGIEISFPEPDKLRLFIPKDSFIGGR
ncbi:MAG: hypothetical protein AAB589_02200 [Patescibacteria group bacterium]